MDLRPLMVAVLVTIALVVPPSLWGGAFGLEGREILVGAIYGFTAALITGALLVTPRSDV